MIPPKSMAPEKGSDQKIFLDRNIPCGTLTNIGENIVLPGDQTLIQSPTLIHYHVSIKSQLASKGNISRLYIYTW